MFNSGEISSKYKKFKFLIMTMLKYEINKQNFPKFNVTPSTQNPGKCRSNTSTEKTCKIKIRNQLDSVFLFYSASTIV